MEARLGAALVKVACYLQFAAPRRIKRSCFMRYALVMRGFGCKRPSSIWRRGSAVSRTAGDDPVGLNSGEIVVCAIGNDLHMEYRGQELTASHHKTGRLAYGTLGAETNLFACRLADLHDDIGIRQEAVLT
jgi:hypothetical protein